MTLVSDLRTGLRLLAKEPIASATAVVALALGIALATSGFVVAREFLWSELPYPAADRFVRIYAHEVPSGNRIGLDAARLEALQARTDLFEHVGAAGARTMNIVLPSGRLDAAAVTLITPGTLAYTPLSPIVGRMLIDDDARAGAAPVGDARGGALAARVQRRPERRRPHARRRRNEDDDRRRGAGLVLARSLARAREFSVRAALGASRGAATLLACGVAGAIPAWRATRRDVAVGLRSGDARAGDARFGRLASALVMGQIALSGVSLFAAMIFADTFRSYGASTASLPDQEVLAAMLSLGNADAADVEKVAGALRTIPGITASGITSQLPRQSPPLARIEIEGVGAAHAPMVEVTAGALETIGTQPAAGRLLRRADFPDGAAHVAVVNEPFARKFFGNAPPLGRRFRLAQSNDGSKPAGPWREIVGVVPDLGLSPGDESMAGGFYVPMTRASFAYAVIRVPASPLAHSEAMRRALGSLQPAIIPTQLSTLTEAASEERAMFATVGAALTTIGGVTLMLALAGAYAMMSLMVTRRTREIGIRLALGAPTGRIVRVIIGRTAWQVGLGAVAGALLSQGFLALRGIFVFRVSDGGSWALPLLFVTLVGAGIAASWIPLRRALAVRPVEALRAE